ncbi:MAG: hypothetical protein F6K39_34225 [Okeania sp. SIO3B3]|nr:hypothetical protein [Okeania sp. SIO3B3]
MLLLFVTFFFHPWYYAKLIAHPTDSLLPDDIKSGSIGIVKVRKKEEGRGKK